MTDRGPTPDDRTCFRSVAVKSGTTADICGQEPDVDYAPNTKDLDLAPVTTREELAAFLRIVHARADKPSLRKLEARTRHDATPLSRTVVSEMLAGKRSPKKAVMVAFLRACGVQDDRMEPWLHAWERIAAQAPTPAQNRTIDAASGRQAQIASDVLGRSNFGTPLQEVVGNAQEQHASATVPTKLPASGEDANTPRLREEIDRLGTGNTTLRLESAVIGRQSGDQQPHPALESNFTILQLPESTPGVVFVEGLIGSTYLERPEDLERYCDVFNKLQSIALNPNDTADMLAKLQRSYKGDLEQRLT